MIKKIFSQYVLLLMTVGAVTILVDIDGAMGQDYPALSGVASEPSPPEELPTPAIIQPTVPDENLGYQALEQGPVHEAFAAPVSTDPTQGTRVLDKPPPQPINEQPPEAGANIAGMKWIPGYWAWNDEVSDYVWVSGLWRRVPQGRNWTPGFWSVTQSGHHRWTSGYWAREGISAETANLVPVPPRSIDNGPSTPAPGDDYFWVPGTWEYANQDYRWRSGYWSLSKGDWVWQPACYHYTPKGYLLVDGYWDYLPTDRGQLYAPVTFYEPIYLQTNYIYRPCYPLTDGGSTLLSLFIRPGYPHYYYGNFFGPSNASRGYRPWYDVGHGSGYITPWLVNYDRIYRKSGIDFVDSIRRYEDHSHSDWKQKQPKHNNEKRSAVIDVPRMKDAEAFGKRAVSSMDAFIRSEAGRVEFNPAGKPFKDKSNQNFAGPSSKNSPSTGPSISPDNFPKIKSNNNIRSDIGQSGSQPSNGSKKSSKSVDQSDRFSPPIQGGPFPPFNQKNGSPPSIKQKEQPSNSGGSKLPGFSGDRGSSGKGKSESKSGGGESKGGGKGKK
jgi:WXXGXW repeat (2 copies)